MGITPTARYTTRSDAYTLDPVADFGQGIEPALRDATAGWVTSWTGEGAGASKPALYNASYPPGQPAPSPIGVWFEAGGAWVPGEGTGNAALPSPQPAQPPAGENDFLLLAQTRASQTGFDGIRDGTRPGIIGDSNGPLSGSTSRNRSSGTCWHSRSARSKRARSDTRSP